MNPIRFSAALGIVVVLAGACGASHGPAGTEEAAVGLPATTVAEAAPPVPAVGAGWQYQLSPPLNLTVEAEVFVVDGADTSAADVEALGGRGAYLVCYLSAGTVEDWRSDADEFPAHLLGRELADWPGERWLDVRRSDLILPVLARRVEVCADKGFHAVELDNVDGHLNDSGFDLDAADQLAFNRAAAAVVHEAGLAVALKNDPGQVAELVDDFDFAIVEECVSYRECGRYDPFVTAGKPVFLVEYDLPVEEVCPVARRHGFSAIVKDRDLRAPLTAC